MPIQQGPQWKHGNGSQWLTTRCIGHVPSVGASANGGLHGNVAHPALQTYPTAEACGAPVQIICAAGWPPHQWGLLMVTRAAC